MTPAEEQQALERHAEQTRRDMLAQGAGDVPRDQIREVARILVPGLPSLVPVLDREPTEDDFDTWWGVLLTDWPE